MLLVSQQIQSEREKHSFCQMFFVKNLDEAIEAVKNYVACRNEQCPDGAPYITIGELKIEDKTPDETPLEITEALNFSAASVHYQTLRLAPDFRDDIPRLYPVNTGGYGSTDGTLMFAYGEYWLWCSPEGYWGWYAKRFADWWIPWSGISKRRTRSEFSTLWYHRNRQARLDKRLGYKYAEWSPEPKKKGEVHEMDQEETGGGVGG